MKVYGVGTAKSGTHSIAGLFERNYRARHEADHENLIELILRKTSGGVSRNGLLDELSQREHGLGLSVDVSQLNVFILPELLTLFPEAVFILTIRDCFSWLRSYLDHQLRFSFAPAWLRLRHLRFGASRFAYSRHERVLEQHGLYSIHSYFRYWHRHNEAVLGTVPADRLLIVRTSEISHRIDEIARFAGTPASSLDVTKSHLFRSSARFSVLAQVDPHFLQEQMLAQCRPIMVSLFQEVTPDEVLL
jgi:hypothetical protein